MPIRLDLGLIEAAKLSGDKHSRSATQQLTHWARLGRALEESLGLDLRAVEAVLDGRLSYDALGGHEQAIVRTAWDEGIDEDLAALDLEERFRAAGESWSEADEDGHIVVRGAE